MSPDFGYGIMQVTSGMAGAFGSPDGSLDPGTQSRVASDYRFNIAYGMNILLKKWAATPTIGNGDPAVIENWYYAIWAYNGWGWVNNPNNPRFTRTGTPATDPSSYPYQERVLYLVAHPPRDSDGNPLWKAVPVTLPSRGQIGSSPGSYTPAATHRQVAPAVSASYQASALSPAAPSHTEVTSVHVVNTGTAPWLSTGSTAVTLTYDLFSSSGDPWQPFSPFSTGVIALGQAPVPLPHNVLPGRSVTLRVKVQAPAAPGLYRVAWDLEGGAGGLFSQLGVVPRVRRLRVESGVSLATPTPTIAPTAQPLEDLKYVADTSMPDGSEVPAGSAFTKSWLVINPCDTPWTNSWALQLVSGKAFGARRIPLPATPGCHTANILATMTAPRRTGAYTSVWQLRDPSGRSVGEKLTLVVRVVSGTGPSPSPTPLPSPTVAAPPTPTPTPLG